jgi:hypothetical protein
VKTLRHKLAIRKTANVNKVRFFGKSKLNQSIHGQRTPVEEIAFTAWLKIKSNPNPKLLGLAEAYFLCHNGTKFKISLIHAFIGYP